MASDVIPLVNIPQPIRKLIIKKYKQMKKDTGLRKIGLGRAAVLLIKDQQLEIRRLEELVSSLKNGK